MIKYIKKKKGGTIMADTYMIGPDAKKINCSLSYREATQL